MKKISLILVAAMALFATACGDSTKKTEGNAAETTETTETPAPATENADVTGSDVLKQYEDFVEKAIPLLKKMKDGDMTAASEYATLALELATFMEANQEALAGLSEADAVKYTELAQKLADAAQ